MRRPSRIVFLLAVAPIVSGYVCAQNLESIGRAQPIVLTGGIAVNQIFHASESASNLRSPYTFHGSGNLNIALYGWSIPLAFNVTNHQTSFSQPFNQYALHPRWRWISLHAGNTSMAFSPYTVNGHMFAGVGTDVEPGDKWKISAFGGRMLKARPLSHENAGILPTYQRNGYGIKARFGHERNFVQLILFRAEDVRRSIDPPPDSLQITPQENAVASITFGKTILARLYFNAEVATSAISRDVRAEAADHNHLLALGGILFKPRLSSSYYRAIRTSVNYQDDAWRIGIAWERVDPEYKTLGAYYFNNDLENVAINTTVGLFANKLNLNASLGIQHDNLNHQKISTMRRAVGAFQMTYSPSQSFNANVSASTFQTHTHIRPVFDERLLPYENADTLTFTQIARNATLSVNWTLPGSDIRRQHFSLHASLQDAADQQGQSSQHAGTRFINTSLGYALTLIPTRTTISLNATTSFNSSPWANTVTTGPTASLTTQTMNRRMRLMISGAWNASSTDGESSQTITTARLNAAWHLHEQHQLTCSIVALRRAFADKEKPTSTDYTATLGYQYSFGSRKQNRLP